MLDPKIYGDFAPSWCPGCGNFDILAALKLALAKCELPPERILMVSGIGQAAKTPHYLRCNAYNGLHGRALPTATGARLANPDLAVIVESGDGCLYGEGGNHLLAAMRRNINLTVLAHNNGIYGLTKGQASPTSTADIKSKVQPFGVYSLPFNPIAAGVALGATWVGRGFSGDTSLADLIAAAILHPGFALLDILTPCVSFNKHNTFAWYKQRCRPLPPDYDPADKFAALAQAEKWEEEIPLGLIYRAERPSMESHFPMLENGPLSGQPVDKNKLREIMNGYR